MPASRRSVSEEWPPRTSLDNGEPSAARLEAEREAKRVNDEIDRLIEHDRQELKKRRPQAKLLLLGQSEAGKSTLLKNFQLLFAPAAFEAEAEAWRAVIHYNLVRAVNFIVEVLGTPAPPASDTSSTVSRSLSSMSNYSSGRIGTADRVRALRMRLSPLRQVELMLHERISPESSSTSSTACVGSLDDFNPPRKSFERSLDTSIRARPGWKALSRLRRPTSTTQDELLNSRQVIDACRDDIVALWTDQSVREELSKRDTKLEDYHIYFLNNAPRIATTKYMPNAQDILRARVQTIGVEEHRLVLETARPGDEWIFYDVEGRRCQRINAMIFLSPISHFDVFLKEDPTINSMMDSFALWKQICESKLLAKATFILFLNKMDLLDKKLKSGVQFSSYASSFKDQPNDVEHVALYCKRKFLNVHRQSSPEPRQLHIHTSCAIVSKFFLA
ncbi:G-alpha-domain-containing protein [Trametopsis cervina]|nr:G-alpha-domain-containing protein [Trametopsis cervina]